MFSLMMSNELFIKGVQALGWGSNDNIVKMHYYFKKSSSLLLGIMPNQIYNYDEEECLFQYYEC